MPETLEHAEQKTYRNLVELAKTETEPNFIQAVAVAWEFELINREMVERLAAIFLRHRPTSAESISAVVSSPVFRFLSQRREET